MNKEKGSLTVEATVSLIIFISVMLLFLFIAKIVLVEYTMQTITSETAKRVADSSYMFQVIANQLNYAEPEDDSDKDNRYGKQVAQIGIKDVAGGVFSIFTKNLMADSTAKKTANVQGGLVSMGVDLIFSAGKLILQSDAVEAVFWTQKQNMQDKILREIIESASGMNGMIDSDKIIVDYVKYPESSTMFNKRKTNEIYNNISIDPDRFIEKEDVMVTLSYPFEITLPFLGTKKYIISKTSVEHAWIYGGNGIAAKTEGLMSKLVSEVTNIALYGFVDVYITNNGNTYHRINCTNIDGEYVTAMRKYNAMKQGFKACATCNP